VRDLNRQQKARPQFIMRFLSNLTILIFTTSALGSKSPKFLVRANLKRLVKWNLQARWSSLQINPQMIAFRTERVNLGLDHWTWRAVDWYRHRVWWIRRLLLRWNALGMRIFQCGLLYIVDTAESREFEKVYVDETVWRLLLVETRL